MRLKPAIPCRVVLLFGSVVEGGGLLIVWSVVRFSRCVVRMLVWQGFGGAVVGLSEWWGEAKMVLLAMGV
jgi:hypothetical protein